MEMIMNVVGWVTVNLGTIVTGVLAVLGGFSILAKLTPTQADDAIIQKVIDVIQKLGLKK